MRSFSLLALGASLAAALQIQSPIGNSTLTRGKNYGVAWSTVDTDPTTLSLYLVNFVNWPPSYVPLEFDVEVASGEYQVRIPCDTEPSFGYQINANNGTNTYVIYSQSDKFFIDGPSCVDPTPAPTCPPQSTATVTVTVSGNSTLTTPAGPPAATSTYAGKCPETIGWNGGYTSAITLTSIPSAGQPVATAPPGAVTKPKHCRKRRDHGHHHRR